jgi:hypothetical protein
MKIFRYRKPSIKTILGITKVKRKIRKSTGISKVQSFTPTRIKQKLKYDGGYNKPIFKHVRELSKGKNPGILGFFTKLFK